MYASLLTKGLQSILTLFLATVAIFMLIRLAPGDPIEMLLSRSGEIAMIDTDNFEQKAAELRGRHGLDQGLIQQYVSWLGGVIRLDLGKSIYTQRTVVEEVTGRLPATLLLAAAALLVQLVLGLLFGVAAALRAGKGFDQSVRLACIALAATPAFVLGLFLLSLLSVTLSLYEISSEASLSRLWLPALTLGLLGAAPLIRVVRAHMLAELGQLYVLSAKARGLGQRQLIGHALRNAWLPVSTLTGLSLVGLVSGAVVIESIFSWPGLGKYALDSILLKDYPAIQGYALTMVGMVIGLNLGVDALYAAIDPRVRRGYQKEKI